LIWLRIGPVEGSCEHCNELSVSVKCWEFLEYLHNWGLLQKGSAPRVSEYGIIMGRDISSSGSGLIGILFNLLGGTQKNTKSRNSNPALFEYA
jgi:hypothetical protein